jgi:hypothetical protein
MGSAHFILTRIGTMNLSCARQRFGVRGRAQRFTALAWEDSSTSVKPDGSDFKSKAATTQTSPPQSKTWWLFQRFLESEHLPNADVSWGHEPLRIPFIRPSGTFSPIEGEGWDEGVRFRGPGLQTLGQVHSLVWFMESRDLVAAH